MTSSATPQPRRPHLWQGQDPGSGGCWEPDVDRCRTLRPGDWPIPPTDPVAGDSANKYDYTNQNPIGGFDLDGKQPICSITYGPGDQPTPCWGWIMSRPNSEWGVETQRRMGTADGNLVCAAHRASSSFSDRGNITAVWDLVQGKGHAAWHQLLGGAPATAAGRAAWWYDHDARHLKKVATVAAKGASAYRSVAGWPVAIVATGSDYLC